MSTRWRMTDDGIFKIVDQIGMVGKFFGGFLLFFACLFLYWLGRTAVEYFLFGTLQDILYALPGMAVTLFMAALFGVPGMLFVFLKKVMVCDRTLGVIQNITSVGLFQRVKEFRFSDIKEVRVSNRKEVKLLGNNKRVASWFKFKKGRYFTSPTSGAQLFVVELVVADEQRVTAAVLEKWDAVELGKQLAGYLGIEFRIGEDDIPGSNET